jgi:hypothetical protein
MFGHKIEHSDLKVCRFPHSLWEIPEKYLKPGESILFSRPLEFVILKLS